MFTKPFYYGWFEYPKGSARWYRGKHQPMVTEAEYDRVQALLGRNGNPRPKSHFAFAFTGLIRCGNCGRMVTAEEKHQVICGHCRLKFAYRNHAACPRCETPIEKMENPRFLRYTYYHCSRSGRPVCRQKCVSAAELEKQIDQYLARVQISERFKDWAIKYLHELHKKECASRNDMLAAQQKAYQECVRRIDSLVKLKTTPGNADGSLLSDEEYGRQRMELLKEKSALEELLRDSGHRVEKWMTLAEQTFEFACTARSRFANGDPKTKKEILAAIGSNLTLKDKTLCIEARKPFFILETSIPGDEPENGTIELRKRGSTPRQKGRKPGDSCTLRGGRHDVRTFGPKHKKIATSIYHFFRRECTSGSFKLSDWKALMHPSSIEEVEND